MQDLGPDRQAPHGPTPSLALPKWFLQKGKLGFTEAGLKFTVK